MLTPYQQKQVWEGMLGAEIRSNYFADLSVRAARKQRAATLCTVILSSSAAGAVLSDVPAQWTWVRGVLSVLAAVISAYSLVMQNQKVAVDGSDLHARWNRLASQYRSLWGNVYADEAEATLNSIILSEQELSKPGVALPYKKKLLTTWQDHVEADHKQELAHV